MKNEKIKEKKHVCIHCRKLFPESKIIFAPDPYASEINDDKRDVWECDECRELSAAEV